jgi:hypothetical protein
MQRHMALTTDEALIMILARPTRRRCELSLEPPVHRRTRNPLAGRRMKIDGHCHCGEITFTAEVDPEALNICHCTDCQTLSGSAFRVNVHAPEEHFVLRCV